MLPKLFNFLNFLYTKNKKDNNSLALKKSNNFLTFLRFISREIIIGFDLVYKVVTIFFYSLNKLFFNSSTTTFSYRFKNFIADFIFRIMIFVRGKMLWDKFRFMSTNCKRTQLEVLMSILNKNKNTAYGKEHKFSSIKSVEDFQKQVSVNEYEDLRSYIDRLCNGERNILTAENPVIYATTSGTTGKPKFLPMTATSIYNEHKFAKKIWLYHLGMNSPEFMSGKILAIVSPAVEGFVEDGTAFGSCSGYMYKTIPKLIKKKYVLPSFVMGIKDYSAKYYLILRLALAESHITFLSTANPSTILLLCQKLNEWSDDLIEDIKNGTLNQKINFTKEERKKAEAFCLANPERAEELRLIKLDYGHLAPSQIWPELMTIGCWTGGNAGTFIEAMKPYFNKNVEIRELGYLSSEFKGSIPILSNTNSGLLTIHNNFFEFVDVDDWNNNEKEAKFILAHELKAGKDYYIFLTNNNGLYRYNMNDIIHVTENFLATPMITFLQKGKGVTNITGEKLYEKQLISAVEQAKKDLQIPLNFYMGFASVDNKRYELIAEFNKSIDDLLEKEFINRIDTNLQKINLEYATKRKSLRLGDLVLRKLPTGGFDAFKTKKIKAGQREGQFKIVSLTSNKSILQELELQN